MIWFATVRLGTQVHMQALGFTTLFWKYVYADSQEAARRAVTAWAEQNQLDLRQVEARPSLQQEIRTYTLIEQILDLPESVLQAEYDRRDYPADWRVPPQRSCIAA